MPQQAARVPSASDSTVRPRGRPARATMRCSGPLMPVPTRARTRCGRGRASGRGRRSRRAGADASLGGSCGVRGPPSIALSTRAALSGSRSAVGSSRITSGASRRKARASAIRRSLAGRERPAAVADDRLVPVGQLADEAVGAGERGRLANGAVRGAVRSPRRMLSATVPRKRVGRCGNPRDLAPARPPGRSRRGRRRRPSHGPRSAR